MTRKKLRASADNSLLIAEILRERLEAVEPRAAFRHELYGRLVREAYLQRERHETNERRGAAAALRDFFLLRRGWTMACCLVLLTASGITTGYAYTSPDVTRESNLYFLKRAVEQAKMLAAATDEEEARAYIDLSARRVAEANVEFDATRFRLQNKANPTQTAACTAKTADGVAMIGIISGSFLVECQAAGLDARIDPGADLPLVLQSFMTNTRVTVAASSLQVSLQNFSGIDFASFGPSGSHLRWADSDNGASPTFLWVEYPESVIKSTLYSN